MISRVGSGLSPGGSPPAAATAVGKETVSIFSTDPATAKIETAVIPALIPVSERVGRTTVGVPTGDELSKEVYEIELAITSVTPVYLTLYTGTPTEVGVRVVEEVFLLTTPARG